jgi:hypothetical protein
MEFDVTLTESLLRRVALRRVLRRWPLTVLAWCLVGPGIYLDLRDGSLDTVSVIVLTAVVVQLLLFGASYLHQRNGIAEWKRLQGESPIHYQLSDETVRATSNLGSSELKWPVFRELGEHPDYILLRMGRSGHLTLPRADIPDEALAFIREQFTRRNLPIRKA